MSSPRIFRYFKTSPEIIRLAVMMYVRYPLSLRTIEDMLHERGIDITHETVRFWWNRFRTIFAAEIRRHRVAAMRHFRDHCAGMVAPKQSSRISVGVLRGCPEGS